MSDAMFSASEIEEAQGKIDRIDRGLEGWEPYEGYHAEDRGYREHDLTWLVPDYRAALQLLKEHGLGMCCDGFETGECAHFMQCECGWRRAPCMALDRVPAPQAVLRLPPRCASRMHDNPQPKRVDF